jgi:hypothetical protein
MTDPEREHLLRRLEESERARRRWKVLALAGTPFLLALLLIAAANAVSSALALREMALRERENTDIAMQAEEQAREAAEEALQRANVAERAQQQAAAVEALEAARQALQGEQMPREP